MVDRGEYLVKNKKKLSLAEWLDFQLHVLGEYGHNTYEVYFYPDREVAADPTLRPGAYEAYEYGFFGDSLSWSDNWGE